MDSREKIIQQIIYIPIEVRLCKTKSTIQCLQETEYKALEGKVSVWEFESVLRSNLNVVNSWLEYSADKRSGNGWYIAERQQGIEVGYYSAEGFRNIELFDNMICACAKYIYHEVSHLSEIAETVKRGK
jgi:hypothetical protein